MSDEIAAIRARDAEWRSSRGEYPTFYVEAKDDIGTLLAHIDRLEAECARLRALLREWRTTPFFDKPSQWQKWVEDFGPRVDAALRGEEAPK